MNEGNPFSALNPDVTGWVVRIAWHGPEDKPFYKALLVSPSRTLSTGREPFWGYAEISAEEFHRLLDALASWPGHSILPGPYRPDGAEYYVEIEADGQTYHRSLGFDHDIGAVLKHVAAALEPDHRRPIEDILVRIGQA